MDALINFIKEALAGKKMSAEWIVTLAVAIAGLAWAGTLAYQKYEGMQSDIVALKDQAHEQTPAYDDAQVQANKGDIIRQTQKLESIEKEMQRYSKVPERLERIENQVENLGKDVDRATDGRNPLSL